MTSFHHPLSPLVLVFVLVLLLVILRGRYRPDHVELEHHVPITGQFNGNRLQDGRCYLKETKKNPKNHCHFVTRIESSNRENGFPSSRSHSNKVREKKKTKERIPNRSPDREIDAIILQPWSHRSNVSSIRVFCRERTFPRCATRNQTADTYHERAALWKSETPPPGQQQLPRSLTRDGVVGVVTVTPVVPEERLEDPCQNQHHRPQAPHFSELPAEISRFAVANDHRSVLSWEERVEERVFLEGRQHYSRLKGPRHGFCSSTPRPLRGSSSTPSRSVHACLNFVLSLRVIARLFLFLSLSRYVTNPL